MLHKEIFLRFQVYFCRNKKGKYENIKKKQIKLY